MENDIWCFEVDCNCSCLLCLDYYHCYLGDNDTRERVRMGQEELDFLKQVQDGRVTVTPEKAEELVKRIKGVE